MCYFSGRSNYRLTHWCDHSMICEMGSIDYYTALYNHIPKCGIAAYVVLEKNV
jgi:hypothetical protein